MSWILFLGLVASCGSDDGGQDAYVPKRDLFPSYLDRSSGFCSPANCATCCQAGLGCVLAFNNASCGTGNPGGPCVACQPPLECLGGACTTAQPCSVSCPPKNGCCDTLGTCQTGSSVEACGSGGAACVACDTASQVCQGGQCVAKSSGLYKVFLVKASVDNKGCGGWLEWYGCDVFVILTAGGTTKTSDKIDNNDNPDWSALVGPPGQELVTAPMADLKAGLSVVVKDDDWPTEGEELGRCTFTVGDSELAAGQMTQACGDYVSALTLAFQPTD